MRHTTRALLSVLIVAHCCQFTAAQESRRSWWPFGAEDEPTRAPAQTATASLRDRTRGSPEPTRAPAQTATATPSSALPQAGAATPAGPQSAQAPVAQYYPSTASPTDRSFSESPFPKFTWPKVQMPQLSLPKPQMPQLLPNREQVDETRNAWVEKSPNAETSSPLQAMRDGARRVSQSTRAAWRKTVDVLTPGDPAPALGPGSQIARREIKPPFWKRMFGSQQPEPQGPQTIPQWMAQDRVDP